MNPGCSATSIVTAADFKEKIEVYQEVRQEAAEDSAPQLIPVSRQGSRIDLRSTLKQSGQDDKTNSSHVDALPAEEINGVVGRCEQHEAGVREEKDVFRAQKIDIQKLICHLKPRNDNLMDPSIRALWSACIGSKTARLQLLDLLREGSDDQKEITMDVLTLLTDDGYGESIMRAGVIPHLIDQLKSDRRSLKESAAYALSALVEHNDHIAAEVVLVGAIAPLAALFQSGFDYGVYALAKFASLSTINAGAIADEAAIASFVVLLKHGTDEQQKAAALGLQHSASTSDEIRIEIAREAGTASLLSPSQHPDVESCRLWPSRFAHKSSSMKALKANLRHNARRDFSSNHSLG